MENVNTERHGGILMTVAIRALCEMVAELFLGSTDGFGELGGVHNLYQNQIEFWEMDYWNRLHGVVGIRFLSDACAVGPCCSKMVA
jgi:hypothetical protein